MPTETVGPHEIPDTCPQCGADYTRTWTGDARPLGGPYRRFEHDTDDHPDDCLVPITDADQ